MTGIYDPTKIVDEPTFHDLARSLGTLTWGTWDHSERALEDRRSEFIAAHPPEDPLRYLQPGLRQVRPGANEFAPPALEARLERLRTSTFESGSIHELLARFGLRLADGPAVEMWRDSSDGVEIEHKRDLARRRNHKLRVLHGQADVEAKNMDAAKAEYIDREEKKRAAREVREALRQMRNELSSDE
jgi:hypothetical protein